MMNIFQSIQNKKKININRLNRTKKLIIKKKTKKKTKIKTL